MATNQKMAVNTNHIMSKLVIQKLS